MREAPHRFDLTPRQREVLDLMARGLTNYEIAEALGVSLSGAKWHVSEVLSKLGVASREEAAAFWRTYNRPTARLSRAPRGLLALPALKLAGAAVVGSVALFVCTAAITATFGSDDPYGSDAQLLVGPHVVRQVFSESTESEGRLQEVIGDAYVLVGLSGEPVAFAARYYSPEGDLQQFRYVDSQGERAYLQGGANETCVVTLPLREKLFEGMLLEPEADDHLSALGFSPGGSAGPPGLSSAVPAPPLLPIESHAFSPQHVSSLWTRTKDLGDHKAVSTFGWNSEGLPIAYWTETRDENGGLAIRYSKAYSRRETYDVSAFDWIKAELNIDVYPTCQSLPVTGGTSSPQQ